MTNNRYVVLNCPAITTGWHDEDYICNTHQMGCGHCKDCTDCIIKQVIEKCKYIIDDDICLNCNKFERGLECFECDYDGHREDIMRNISRISLAKQILQLFDIEEINK